MNAEELAICRRRGHDVALCLSQGQWIQCKLCGMWVREVVEEREDEPPKSEQSPLTRKWKKE
jgi:hypothetical protein